jgi:hypothetical protein
MDLGPVEQQLVRDSAEERYVSYAVLHQSGMQLGNLKVDFQNDFTTGDNRYPKNGQQTLHILDKYSKTVVAKVTHYEGTSFAQKGRRGGGNRTRSGNGKATIPAPMIRSTGRTRNATSAARKGIQQRIVPRSRVMTMIVPR